MQHVKPAASPPPSAPTPPDGFRPAESPDIAARIADFARACKAAARAVTLYPSAHPAIASTLDRLVECARLATHDGPLTLTVLPDGLQVNGAAPARPEAAIGDFAALLHAHQVGALTLHHDCDGEGWRQFLLLVGRAPEDLKARGGIASAWTAAGIGHLEVREIDYAHVLRERAARPATWDDIVAHCLQGDAVELDEQARTALLEIAEDADRLTELVALIEERAAGLGLRERTSALLRMLRGLLDVVASEGAEGLEAALQNVTQAVAKLPIDAVTSLVHAGPATDAGGAIDLGHELRERLDDEALGTMVARGVVADRGPSARLAEAFQALVPDEERRHRVLQVARGVAEESPLGREGGFDAMWDSVVEMVSTYSDSSFVGDEYARELSGVRTQALDVEHTSDDPPDRVAGWLATVSDAAVRALDVELLIDLIRIERDPAKWRAMTGPVISHLEDLLLVGDFGSARRLAEALVREASDGQISARQAAAREALDRLVGGAMMRHVVSHLGTIDDHAFGEIQALCQALGEPVIRSLAEALSVEERDRPRQRLTDLLISFGALGRRSVERLKKSPNSVVRRTAIYLLREFGGSEALPDLESLLNDAEPNVQREAIRALAAIGTDEAYATLQKALESGTAASRSVIMQALTSIRDERAAPLLAYIVDHADHRGPLKPVYVRAIEALGALGDDYGIDALGRALHRGEWYAPLRTSALRQTAASALGRLGSPAALAALEEAGRSGPRGTRAAARAALAQAGRRARAGGTGGAR